MCIPDSLAGHIKPLKREELECGKHCPLSPCVFEICGEIVKVKKLDDLARSGIVVLRQTLLRYGFAVTWGFIWGLLSCSATTARVTATTESPIPAPPAIAATVSTSATVYADRVIGVAV